ncbi:MAG TPA: alpha-E domain-containing protein, partial [Oceanipulchritudo sp.]|nr:alpha-E domain-containing protein [Oceanipulchritudo sp.]
DPVAFANVNETGIPGLVQCLRRGTVQVANAMGCAVADNRALLRHADAIVRFYSGRKALLPTVPTYHGYDLDQSDWIRDNLESLTLKAVCHPETLKRSNPEASRLFEAGNLAKLMDRDPRLVVGQLIPESSRLPVIGRETISHEGLVMRVYCIMGRRPMVLSGGLTRLERPGDESSGSGKRYHALKDTWALASEKPRVARSGRLEPRISTDTIPLPSRAAEAAYWMGRYLERGVSTARMLNTLEELRWGELSPGERELYTPLWLGMIKATGGRMSRFRKGDTDPAELTRELLLDESETASVKACFHSVRFNAESIRSFITPELWRSTLEANALFSVSAKRLKGTVMRDFIESIIRSGDCIYGAAHRTLMDDAGWHFLNTGMHVERGLNHVVILAEVLPHVARRQLQHLRDDSDLTALLRLLGALDAYHRQYRSRAYLDRVAELLWKSPACTSSVLHAASSIESALLSVGRVSNMEIMGSSILGQTTSFITWLRELSLERIFPARAVELDRGLTRTNLTASTTIREAEASLTHMQAFFESTHAGLEDRFFSHIPEEAGTPH